MSNVPDRDNNYHGNVYQLKMNVMDSLIVMFSNTRSSPFSSVSVTLYSVILSVGREKVSDPLNRGSVIERSMEATNRSESTRYRVNLVHLGIWRMLALLMCISQQVIITVIILTVALNSTDLFSPLSRIRCRSPVLPAQFRSQ